MKRIPARSEQAVPALRVYTLGQVGVTVGGRPAIWHAQTAEELFFYLLSYPGGRSKEEILETLWGLDPSPAANNRFRVTVFRVRTALGSPGAIHEEHGRYQLAEEILHSTDLFDFYQALAEAQGGASETARLEAFNKALLLYRGDYLPGFSNNWISQAREEHKTAYVQALLEVALIHYDRQDWPTTCGLLERAWKADPFIGENHHQRLIWCLAAKGDRYGAIEHYRRFVKFLHHELGDSPMLETKELVDHIKQGDPITSYHEVRGMGGKSPQA